jgi:hypothetical protein
LKMNCICLTIDYGVLTKGLMLLIAFSTEILSIVWWKNIGFGNSPHLSQPHSFQWNIIQHLAHLCIVRRKDGGCLFCLFINPLSCMVTTCSVQWCFRWSIYLASTGLFRKTKQQSGSYSTHLSGPGKVFLWQKLKWNDHVQFSFL